MGIEGTRRRQPQKEEALQLVVEANTTGERPTAYWWYSSAKVFKAHALLLELSDNLINALKLLANQQNDGDSPIQSIVTGLHERTRRLRRLIKADNRRAASTKQLMEKSGKSCIATTEKCVRQQELRSRVKVKKRKLCGQ